MQLFEATLETSRFIGATKRFYLSLDNGDKFISVKPGSFEENFIVGEKFIIGIHQDDLHVFKAPKNILYELSLS
ncbi:MAG: TOBE domain-containing protein, partial [Candidatus Thorarchaeota archaeon]